MAAYRLPGRLYVAVKGVSWGSDLCKRALETLNEKKTKKIVVTTKTERYDDKSVIHMAQRIDPDRIV